MMHYSAIAAVDRLVADFGVDVVVDALLEEAETAPDEQLGAVEDLLDVVMAGLMAEAGKDAHLPRH